MGAARVKLFYFSFSFTSKHTISCNYLNKL